MLPSISKNPENVPLTAPVIEPLLILIVESVIVGAVSVLPVVSKISSSANVLPASCIVYPDCNKVVGDELSPFIITPFALVL